MGTKRKAAKRNRPEWPSRVGEIAKGVERSLASLLKNRTTPQGAVSYVSYFFLPFLDFFFAATSSRHLLLA